MTRVLSILFVCGFLFACAPATKIQTNKDTGYKSEPKRIFVLTDIGSDFGKEYADGFRKKLVTLFKECGAEMEISYLSSLVLDENVYANKMKAYKSDSFLSIKRAGGTRSAEGVLIQVNYDVKLIDVPTNTTVWRAATEVYRGMMVPDVERGQSFAVVLTNRMKTDKIFSSCPLEVVK